MNSETIPTRPDLSIVICVVSDAQHLKGCLETLYQQVDLPSIEIIVPYIRNDNDIASLTSQFPEAKFHPVFNLRSHIPDQGESREHHDELRAIGLGLAKGEIVALIEDHDRVHKYWSKEVVKAHKNTYAAIGGAIENEVDKPLNWAVYFCDFGRYQNPLKYGPSPYISDANISYKRQALEKIKEIWQKSFCETSVNFTLMNLGETLWLSPHIIVYQHRENLSLSHALQERYVWGRSYAGTLAQGITFSKRLLYVVFSPMLPFLLMARKGRDVLLKKRYIGKFVKASPLMLLLLFYWSVGEFVGYLTARPNRFC